MAEGPEEPVPRLRRRSGFKLTTGHVVRIATFSALLILIILYGRTCANAFSKFVTSFGKEDAPTVAPMPKPGTVDQPGSGDEFEVLRLDTMSEAEIKAAIERNRARAAQREQAAGSGSAAGSAGSGTAGSAGTGSGSTAGSADSSGAL